MRTLVALVLLALALPASVPAGAESGPRDEVPPFRLQLVALGPGGRADAVVVGIDPGATEGYDRTLDRAEPPAPFGDEWVQAYALPTRADDAGPRRLHASTLPPALERSWSLAIDVASAREGEVSLAWSAADVARLPARVGLDLTVAGRTVDLREETRVTFPTARGQQTHAIDLRVLWVTGTLPGAPENLTAAPGPLPGDVTLRWDPPPDDGGSPLRGYHVFRAEPEGGETSLGRVDADRTTYTDKGRPAGTMPEYRITAHNRLGEGEESPPASAPGTGRPPTPGSGAPDEGQQERDLAQAEAESPDEAHAPGASVPVARVSGGKAEEDPRRYRVTLQPEGGDETRLTILTVVPLDAPVELSLLHVPETRAPLPVMAGAEADARARDDPQRPEPRPEDALLLRIRVSVQGETVVEDEIPLPYAGGAAALLPALP